MIPRGALFAVIAASVLLSPALAFNWADEESWKIAYVGDEDMLVDSYMQRELVINEDSVAKNFKAYAEGTGVNSMELQTSSQYTEEKDGITYQIGGEVYQQLDLPDSFQVQMDNTHELIYSDFNNFDQDLTTDMNVLGPNGESLLSLQTSMDDNIEDMIDAALENVDQSWYQAFGDGGDISGGINYNEGDLSVTIGYTIPITAAKDGVICNHGHAYKSINTIDIY